MTEKPYRVSDPAEVKVSLSVLSWWAKILLPVISIIILIISGYLVLQSRVDQASKDIDMQQQVLLTTILQQQVNSTAITILQRDMSAIKEDITEIKADVKILLMHNTRQ